jgi:hypothetical protein
MPNISEDKLEKLEILVDRLDSLIASLVNLRTLPDSIHVSALRDTLPEIAKSMRDLLPKS